MFPLTETLGIKMIPARFQALFTDDQISHALSESMAIVREAPWPWETVEVPEGTGFQPMDVPFQSIPKTLSDEEERLGRERLNQAYKRIGTALTTVDQRIAQLGRSGLRRLLLFIGLALVLSAVVILGIGVFRHSEVTLTGKEGAATLLLATGVPILASSYAIDRKMRTLTSRVRVRLAVCLGQLEYWDTLNCFSRAVDELDNAFRTVRQRVEGSQGEGRDIEL